MAQLSVAVQVRMMVNSYRQLPGVCVSVNAIATELSQLSVAVILLTGGKRGMLLHSAGTSAGTPFKTGELASETVTFWVNVVLFPHSSTAVHVRKMVY